jgi:hypothetical protein
MVSKEMKFASKLFIIRGLKGKTKPKKKKANKGISPNTWPLSFISGSERTLENTVKNNPKVFSSNKGHLRKQKPVH